MPNLRLLVLEITSEWPLCRQGSCSLMSLSWPKYSAAWPAAVSTVKTDARSVARALVIVTSSLRPLTGLLCTREALKYFRMLEASWKMKYFNSEKSKFIIP